MSKLLRPGKDFSPRTVLLTSLTGLSAGLFLGFGIVSAASAHESAQMAQADKKLDALYKQGGYQPIIGNILTGHRTDPKLQAEIDRQNQLRDAAMRNRLGGWALFTAGAGAELWAATVLIKRYRANEQVQIAMPTDVPTLQIK